MKLKTINDMTIIQKQGILTILPVPAEFQLPTNSPAAAAPPLRRTLSADMSSTNTNWFTRQHFSSIKKIASTEQFPVCAADSSAFSSPSEVNPDDFKEGTIRLRGSIEQRKIECEKRGDVDSWSSILFHNSAATNAPKSPALPYLHPLVMKSTTSLSENSLQICTESLGSESGSDGFSSHPPSEAGDDMDQEMLKTKPSETETFEWRPIKFGRKKSSPRSFPPPIPSLCSPDGASVCIQSRREKGRLILHAVSVPSQKNFRADRRDGRLVLSVVTTPANLKVREEEDEFEQLLDRDFEGVKESEIAADENDLEAEDLEIPMEKAPRSSSSVMNFHRLPLMKKPSGLNSRNPPWPKEEDPPETPTPLSLLQSLPPRPPSLAAAASMNAYEYYWRSKPNGKSAGIQNPIGEQQTQPIKSVTQILISSNNQMASEKQRILVLRGKSGEFLIPLSNGCKVPRTPLVLREPCCIATT